MVYQSTLLDIVLHLFCLKLLLGSCKHACAISLSRKHLVKVAHTLVIDLHSESSLDGVEFTALFSNNEQRNR